ncbi:THUMP domain-containing protein [Zea mays]|uniref:THUMP domain-containing protein n=1 Tax=Zea mays TaxID=4577 RepID=A0A1D6QKV8_MAIZE|nr:THUMP domain-containing protein [Zea mays]
MAPGGEGKPSTGGGGGGVKVVVAQCDGTAVHYALFYEDLVDGKGSDEKPKNIPDKPLNKKIKFEDSDSSDDEDEDNSGEEADNGNVNDVEKGETAPSEKQQEVLDTSNTASKDNTALSEKKEEVLDTSDTVSKDNEEQAVTADEPREKKQRVEDPPVFEQAVQKETADEPKESTDKPKESSEKNIDDLIDEDLKEIGDRKKRLFASLETGCNGCIFIQMHKRAGDPGPVEIVQNMMSSAALTRKHMSRFILRVLPVEVACYASEEEITKAISPLIEKYFPKECSSGHKASCLLHCFLIFLVFLLLGRNVLFAVLYEARSNTGIDRMKIINAAAKSVPQPHKVDLKNPDKTIVVQIAKVNAFICNTVGLTLCLFFKC